MSAKASTSNRNRVADSLKEHSKKHRMAWSLSFRTVVAHCFLLTTGHSTFSPEKRNTRPQGVRSGFHTNHVKCQLNCAFPEGTPNRTTCSLRDGSAGGPALRLLQSRGIERPILPCFGSSRSPTRPPPTSHSHVTKPIDSLLYSVSRG